MKSNTKHHPLLAIIFALLISITACKTDSIKPVSTTNPRPRLAKIEMSAYYYVDLGYNNDQLLDHYRLVNDNYTSEANFTYNSAKKTIAGTIDGFQMTFVYNGDQLDKIEYRVPGNTAVDHYTKFSYQNGLVGQAITYILQAGQQTPAIKMLYTYEANGDMKTSAFYFLDQLPDHYALVERTEYEYDTKANPIQAASEVIYALSLPKSAHNIKKSILYNGNDQLNETHSYSLNYNDIGMPVTGVENVTYPNSPGINRNIRYTYQ